MTGPRGVRVGPTATEQPPAVVLDTSAFPGGSQAATAVVDGRILTWLVMAALNDVCAADDDIGCCPVCCAPCAAVKALLDADQLDDAVRERGPGWEWWDEANGCVDRDLLARAWRLTGCHECHPGEPPLRLTRTGEEGGRIVGVLTSPHGDFKIDASPDGWAEIERDVAAGRNPVVLTAAPDDDSDAA